MLRIHDWRNRVVLDRACFFHVGCFPCGDRVTRDRVRAVSAFPRIRRMEAQAVSQKRRSRTVLHASRDSFAAGVVHTSGHGGGSHFVHLVLVLIAGSLCSFKLDDIWFGRNWFGGQIAHGAGWGLLPLVLTERNRVYIYERFAANFKLKPITEVMQMQYVGSAYKV